MNWHRKKQTKPKHIAVSGVHSVGALLSDSPEQILAIWVCDKNKEQIRPLVHLAEKHGIAIQLVKAGKLDQIDKTHNGIVAWSRSPRPYSLEWLSNRENALVLVLDRITDAHNFGACLRSAEAAGVTAVIIGSRHSAGLTSGAAKSSSGALFRIPIIVVNSIAKALEHLQEAGWNSIALSEHAKGSLFDHKSHAKQLVIVGNEQSGISGQIANKCDRLVTIPTRGKNASLNVSVAAGVAVLWLGKL